MPRELADHLADGQAVVLPHVVQKPQRVVLGGWGGHRAGRVRPEATRPLLTSGVGTMDASGAQVWASRPSHGDSAGLLPPAPPGATQMEELETRCLQPERGSQSRPGLRTRVVRGRADWRPHSRPSAGPAPGCMAAAAKPAGGGEANRPSPSPLPSRVLTRAALRAFYVGRSPCDPGGFEGPERALETRPSTKTRGGRGNRCPHGGPAGLGRRAEAPTEPSPGTRQMASHTQSNTRWLSKLSNILA